MIYLCEFEKEVTGCDIFTIDFSLVTAKRQLSDIVNDCSGHIITKVNSDNRNRINELLRNGFLYSVGSLSLECKRLLNQEDIDISFEIRVLQYDDLESLYPICDEAFAVNNRFANDPLLGLYNREIHRHWLGNSIINGYADYCCGYWLRSDELVGFGTLHLHDTCASIGLLAVDSQFRRNGVASSLVRHLKKVSLDYGRYRMIVATESDNFPAIICLYSHKDFVVNNFQLALYRPAK